MAPFFDTRMKDSYFLAAYQKCPNETVALAGSSTILQKFAIATPMHQINTNQFFIFVFFCILLLIFQGRGFLNISQYKSTWYNFTP